MNARLKSFVETASPAVRSLLAVVIIAALAGALVPHALEYGAAMRQSADQLQAEQTDREKRGLWDRLGMGYGSERFMACAEVLSEARQHEAKGVYSEVAGIL